MKPERKRANESNIKDSNNLTKNAIFIYCLLNNFVKKTKETTQKGEFQL
ncbi:MAG: hypothetical protein XD49_0952 [Caldanaerobacter subterraneus]|nr:MAG: hypothetical protein XD49_0952 [Caldanaerobacter subterraneus]